MYIRDINRYDKLKYTCLLLKLLTKAKMQCNAIYSRSVIFTFETIVTTSTRLQRMSEFNYINDEYWIAMVTSIISKWYFSIVTKLNEKIPRSQITKYNLLLFRKQTIETKHMCNYRQLTTNLKILFARYS